MSIAQRRAHTSRLTILGATALSSLLLSIPAFAGEVELGGLQSAVTHQRFIVTYRDGSNRNLTPAALSTSLHAAARAVPAKNGQALGLNAVRRLASGPELVKADRPLDKAEAETLMRNLAADPRVASVEVDQIMRPTLVPNDSRLSEQWAFGTSNAGINVRDAWDQATGQGVVVAVIDTGITAHPELQANLLPGYDFITDASVSRDDDGRDADPTDEGDWTDYVGDCGEGSRVSASSWHGSHVAGTIAAATNNGSGVAGTAFNAKIVPVRVLGRCGGYTSDIVDAIVWASGGHVSGVPDNANPAEVINMSLGGIGACSSTYRNAINAAVERGTTVVVAAGNNGMDVAYATPASCPNVVAVAATTSSRSKAYYSNYGSGIDISAPGSDILSTINSGAKVAEQATHASYDGTSMAAPHVAGVVALMQSVVTTPLTPAQVEATLKSSAASFSCSQGCGAGLLDANAAVRAAKAL